jgi:hypothetical protein
MADRPVCVGIKADGFQCGKKVAAGQQRCSTHLKTNETHGPNANALRELEYVHKRQIRELKKRWDDRIQLEVGENNNAENERLHQELLEDADNEIRALRIQQRREMMTLERRQARQIRETGINPDLAANQRREEIRRVNRERAREMWEALDAENMARLNAAIQQREQQQVRPVVRQDNARPVVHQDNQLRNIAYDNQNVHTSLLVQKTKKTVDRILAIPVPVGYRWNMTECSKTPGDIIVHCKLTPKGAWQMSAKYCQDEDIYDFGKGIYGKVLDGVWQYILNSSDKEGLCKVLKQEMEDNIGMCVQGNLTRLCNILSGYMEGIDIQESSVEVLGRRLPLLMAIENEAERLHAAYLLLLECEIPERNWLAWVEPLLESGTARLKADGAGKVIGIEVV